MSAELCKSVIIKKFGGYEEIAIENAPLKPLENNVEVEVEYGGLNFADLYTRLGLLPKDHFPFVLGTECTGKITNIGQGVDKLKIGQRVICYNYNGGLFRDKVRVPQKEIFPLPDNVSFETGAALFVNYLTAYFSLFEIGNIKENQSILILSCTGGVGCAAVQLARTVKNIKIFGTGSSHKKSHANTLQVDTFLSYESFENDIKKYSNGFDFILTNQSGKILDFLYDLLNPLGRIVIIGANNFITNDNTLTFDDAVTTCSLERLIVKNQIVAGLHLGTLLEDNPEKVRRALEFLYTLLENGTIKPVIHTVLPMNQIVEATKLLADRKNFGKVLISMKNQ